MKIFCVGRNYADHAAELGNALPEAPVVFLKPATAVMAPGAPFKIPAFSTRMHYEGELVLRICKGGRNISEADAPAYVDQMTVGIDWTERDLQDNQKSKGLPWEISKAFDNSAFVGEWQPISSLSEVKYELILNGEVKQKGDPNLMLYSVATQISYLSRFFSLEVGDLLFTGTPKGVDAVAAGDVLLGILNGRQVMECHVVGAES